MINKSGKNGSKNKFAILETLTHYGVAYGKKGQNYVCRCPFCKSDGNLKDHNAEINVESNSIYCFTEQKLYNVREIMQFFNGKNIDYTYTSIKEKRVKDAKDNTELAQNYRSQNLKKFSDVKNSLKEKGFTITGAYKYYDLNGKSIYEVIRFEKFNDDGTREKVTLPIKDGLVGLQGVKQIPYRLEQFAYFDYYDEIWLCEGEKCCDVVIASMPTHADVIVLGFRKASDFNNASILQFFKNKRVVIFEDNDRAGSRNTESLIEILKDIAREIAVVQFPEYAEGYDVADYLEHFGWNSLIERIELSERVTTTTNINIKTGTTVKVEKQEEWILEPLVPSNSIILMDGLGGTGKSLLAMELCYAISIGQSFLLTELKPKEKYPILYLTAEETDWRFYERLIAIENAYQQKSNTFHWLSTLSKDFTMPTARLFQKKLMEITPTETFKFLEYAIKQTQAKVVVFDSWINFYGLDENSTEDGIIAYDYLKSLIRRYDCSFLILHHQTKDAIKRTANVFRGTMVFREQARTRIMINTHNDRTKKVEIEKSNYYSDLLKNFPLYIEFASWVWTITSSQGIETITCNNGNRNEKEITDEDEW